MDSAKDALSIVFILLFSLPSSSSTANHHSLVVAPFAMLQLSHSLLMKHSPNWKAGTSMVCERVHIHGLSRVRNLRKFAHLIMVRVSGKDSSVLPTAEVCFHRNISLGIGMCPNSRWEKISNGSRAHSMSPFGYKLLDIQTTNSSLESFVVSIEEEFSPRRAICLILVIILMSLAPILSNLLVFYYGCTIASGVILVILIAFFQGMKKAMKLQPTCPRMSLLIYSSVVGFMSFLFYHFPRFWHSILTEVGIDVEISYASSVDPIVATEALFFGILISSLFRRLFRLRILCRIYRCINLTKLAKRKNTRSHIPDLSASEDSHDKYTNKIWSNEDSNFPAGDRSKISSMAPDIPSNHGFSGSSSNQLHISSFHTTPERRKFSKPNWE